MTEFKASTFRFMKILCRVLVLGGLAIFAIAIFSPFVTGVFTGMQIPEIRAVSIRFWSFMREARYNSINGWILGGELHIQTDWFAAYWSSMFSAPWRVPVWFAGIAVVALFVLQIATIVSGMIAVARPRIGFVSTPLFLSVFCFLFMMAFASFANWYDILYYNLGFWLTLFSTVPFALALMFSIVGKIHQVKLVQQSPPPI